jgi:hypothetical protein
MLDSPRPTQHQLRCSLFRPRLDKLNGGSCVSMLLAPPSCLRDGIKGGCLFIQSSSKSTAAQLFLGWTPPVQPISNLPPVRQAA